MNYHRGLMLLPDSMEEVLIRLPKNLFVEVDGMARNEQRHIEDIICQATKKYIQYKREVQMKELHLLYDSMQKGYEEMARINLHLCSEAFLAEEEAKLTSDRKVIGV